MSQKELQEALLKLRNDKQFAPVIEWLKSLRETARERLEMATDHVQVEQGKAQMVKRILDSIESSPEILAKLK